MKKYTPTLLCVLDGWGLREDAANNAIAAAHTPHFDALWNEFPHGELDASEGEVGLPAGQMGNSEVGHMNIGAGRVVLQDLPRIDAAILDDSLKTMPPLSDFIAKLKASGGACHLAGLLSNGGVHAHQNHVIALAEILNAAGITTHIHAFLDGRDTPPRSAEGFVTNVQNAIATLDNVHISTLCGRYFAMDRDTNWDRVQTAYDAMVDAHADYRFETAAAAITHSYDTLDKGDEFVPATVIGDYTGMQAGDGLLFANFRADRAREITESLCNPDFTGFARTRHVTLAAALSMVEYSSAHNAWMETLFAPEDVRDTIGEAVAHANIAQLRIAETEKYAHVTFFANGGRETPFTNEDRILVPSPDVPTYDLQPEMSAPEVTDKLVEAIESGKYGFILVNYANTDMVGHTGDLAAATKAVEAVDACLGRLRTAIEKADGAMLITADHGNAEMMHDDVLGSAHTAHTLNRVPVVIAGNGLENTTKNARAPYIIGRLADLAPTALTLMGLDVPDAMTGRNLLAAPEA